MNWESNYLTAVIGICGTILAYFVAGVNAKRNLIDAKILAEQKYTENVKIALLEYKSSPEVSALLDLRFRDGHQAGAAEAISNYKTSEGYEALFSVEHSKGKEVGIYEERIRWQLVYTPIIISDDGIFSHIIETGFEMQIFYAGFPINDPLRRITGSHKKSKDENIHKFLDIAEKAVDLAASIAAKVKVPTIVNKPRQEKK